jgi:hypothetical protein
MQFNQFLVKDDEPLLFHTGLRSHFPSTLAALRTVIPPERLRWIGFSHVEADECGALADRPHATAVCSVVAKVDRGSGACAGPAAVRRSQPARSRPRSCGRRPSNRRPP